MYFSTLSVIKIAPTLSLFDIAENSKTAAISIANSFLLFDPKPKVFEPDKSIINITVNSLSSSNTFTKGFPNRAVTFQSIVRTSSPN